MNIILPEVSVSLMKGKSHGDKKFDHFDESILGERYNNENFLHCVRFLNKVFFLFKLPLYDVILTVVLSSTVMSLFEDRSVTTR